jgi:hypothetical protein
MKKTIYIIIALMFAVSISKAQTNYLDTYIGSTVTLTTIGTSSNSINQPRDLDFKPNSNECWVANYGTANGGTNVIFYNAGLPNQTWQYRKDTHTSHFMRFPSAIAFGDDGKWACVSEILNTNSGTFMGPGLWLSDTNIFAKVFQNNWVSGLPLGSHVDMLHQSPFAMGIAHDTAMAYWVMDGYNGNICKYDFVFEHGPGYDDHGAGKIWRYTDVPVTRVVDIPSHMVLDKVNHWLYFIDGGAKTIKRMNTLSGTHTGNLTASNEPLAQYWAMTGATVDVLATLTTQPCGMDYYNGRLIVSDYTTGDIYLYNTTGAFTLTATIVTGHPGMMGVKVGPDGHIWCVNRTESKLYRLDVAAPVNDVSIVSITSPTVENCLLYEGSFYSTAFNVCNGIITPAVTISNNGTSTVTSLDLQYTIDGGVPTLYSWTGSLAAGATASVALPSGSVTNGSHVLSVSIISPDDVDLNNLMTGSFRVINPPVGLPLTEGFTSVIFPPAGWNYVHFNKNNKMTRSTAGGFGASTSSMKMDNYAGAMDITGQKDYLISPVLDMTTATTMTRLKFSVAHARYSTSTSDRLQVLASIDCGNSWTTIYDKMGATLATAATTTAAFTPTAAQWRSDSINLSGFAGQAELILSFTSVSNFGNNVYVDDIDISDLSTGVLEPIASNLFSVYPNPADDKITIVNSQSEIKSIEMYDVLGQKVYSHNPGISSRQITLDVSGISPGIYLLSVNENNLAGTKKIVIQ